MYFRKCSDGCDQPRFERASQVAYGYGFFSQPGVADIESASSIAASGGTSALASGVPLLSVPLPDTRPPVQAVSTTDPTGSATPGGGHRTTAVSLANAFLDAPFGQGKATWSNGELCAAVPSPALYNEDGGGVASLMGFIGLTIGGLLLASMMRDTRGGR